LTTGSGRSIMFSLIEDRRMPSHRNGTVTEQHSPPTVLNWQLGNFLSSYTISH